MIYIYGSLILAVFNLLSMWLIAERWRYCWLFSIVLQVLWTPYDIVTKQYAFIVMGIVMVVIAIRGWRKQLG